MIEELAKVVRAAGFQAKVVRKVGRPLLRASGLPPGLELHDGAVMFRGESIAVEIAQAAPKKREGPANLAQRASWFSKRSGD